MPARKKISLNKIAIIAGSGILPLKLQQACTAQNIQTYIIGFNGYTDQVKPDYWGRIGASSKIIHKLHVEKIQDIVMIGAIKRPRLFDLFPDWITFKFFFKAWAKSFGDSDLLNAARDEIQSMGFKLHGVHEFLPELLMPEGFLGRVMPQAGHQMDVQIGLRAARVLGKQDKGQAVIVKDGKVIAHEGKAGTSALIKKHGQAGALLVKMCKPQQDKDLDLPTLGVQTVQLCADKNMAGIVGQVDNTLIAEKNKMIEAADRAGIFILGVTIDE